MSRAPPLDRAQRRPRRPAPCSRHGRDAASVAWRLPAVRRRIVLDAEDGRIRLRHDKRRIERRSPDARRLGSRALVDGELDHVDGGGAPPQLSFNAPSDSTAPTQSAAPVTARANAPSTPKATSSTPYDTPPVTAAVARSPTTSITANTVPAWPESERRTFRMWPLSACAMKALNGRKPWVGLGEPKPPVGRDRPRVEAHAVTLDQPGSGRNLSVRKRPPRPPRRSRSANASTWLAMRTLRLGRGAPVSRCQPDEPAALSGWLRCSILPPGNEKEGGR